MLNINTQMNTVLESIKFKADKEELVVVKQDIQQMSNRISTLEVSKQPSNTAGIETMISEGKKRDGNLTKCRGGREINITGTRGQTKRLI